jgi:hypothetical protein
VSRNSGRQRERERERGEKKKKKKKRDKRSTRSLLSFSLCAPLSAGDTPEQHEWRWKMLASFSVYSVDSKSSKGKGGEQRLSRTTGVNE